MCEKGKCCQKPEKLIGKPQACTPEQIKECHGDVKVHPCLSQGKTHQQKGKGEPR
jgi:hypothetical protein